MARIRIAIASVLVAAGAAFGQCLTPGPTGCAQVQQYCNSNCPQPNSTVVTCNGEFSIELVDIYRDGALVTFEYQVCQIGGRNALSHWSFGPSFDCLEQGFSLSDIVVEMRVNGEPAIFGIGLDPTTCVYAIKFDDLTPSTTCDTYTVTFDESKLQAGWRLGAGCVLAVTKAGNQDIRRGNNSPGYSCIFGPVCELVPPQGDPGTGCTPGFWKNNGPASLDGTFVGAVFGAGAAPYLTSTLRDALDFNGGGGLDGGKRILLRAASAAYLNTLDWNCPANYPYDTAQVEGWVTAALASGDRNAMIALANELDMANNAGCNLNAHLECIE
jgi:hypothetical protein